MSDYNIGFIGGGEMAWAIACGFLIGSIDASRMFVSNPSQYKLKRFEEEGVNVTSNNLEVFENCEVVFICVKPQKWEIVATEVRNNASRITEKIGKKIHKNIEARKKEEEINERMLELIETEEKQTIISIMAGVTIDTLQKAFPLANIIRTMPNTAAIAQEGITIISSAPSLPQNVLVKMESLLGLCGETVRLPEEQVNCAMSISGCGIGFMLVCIDALADGGVKMGLPRDAALRLASGTLVGAGKMQLRQNQNPSYLKDTVASPGGTTIAGLHELEKGGIRAALMNAVEAAKLRGDELSKSTEKK